MPSQSPEDYVRQVSATTGLPHVMVRRNMQKIRTVLAEMRDGAQRPDAQSRSGGARSRLRHGRWPGTELLSARQVAGRGAAQQFARRAFAVDSGVRPENAAGAEARQRRAVDAVPHHPGADPCGRAARGVRLLSRRSRRRRRDSAAVRARHGLRRRRFHETLAGRSAHRGAWPGLQQDRHRRGRHRTTGRSTWT